MADVQELLQAALAGRYTLEKELGRGGMATVYFADDLKHERPVALKVLHPHILTVLDSGEAEGLLWYTMPYVVAERLGDTTRAIDGYGYVAGMWRYADPELQPFVTEARRALERLTGEPRP